MELRILSVYTQDWVAWLMLLTLVGLGLVEIFQPGYYARAFSSLFTSKERDSIFSGSGNDRRPQLLLSAAHAMLMALGLVWFFGREGEFGIKLFGICLGLSAVMLVLRQLMEGWVALTFFSKGETDTYRRHYRYLHDCATLCCWPLALFGLYLPSVPSVAFIAIACAMYALYCALVIYKQIACFRLTPGALLYIPLYFITTELVPAGALLALAGLLTEHS